MTRRLATYYASPSQYRSFDVGHHSAMRSSLIDGAHWWLDGDFPTTVLSAILLAGADDAHDTIFYDLLSRLSDLIFCAVSPPASSI